MDNGQEIPCVVFSANSQTEVQNTFALLLVAMHNNLSDSNVRTIHVIFVVMIMSLSFNFLFQNFCSLRAIIVIISLSSLHKKPADTISPRDLKPSRNSVVYIWPRRPLSDSRSPHPSPSIVLLSYVCNRDI